MALNFDTPEKELANFVDLVRRLRTAQRRFVGAKAGSEDRKIAYYETKTLERLTDDYVARLIAHAEKKGTLL